MRLKLHFFLLIILVVTASSCGSKGSTGGGDAAGTPDQEDQVGEDVCVGTPCSSAVDCGEPGPCVSMVACQHGCCVIDYVPTGTECLFSPCYSGACSGSSPECLDPQEVICEDLDGDICTRNECNHETGACLSVDAEIPLDGVQPHIDSQCWEGAICVDGVLDYTNATPKPAKQDCDKEEALLPPFGCIDEMSCDDSSGACEPIKKPEGTQCWKDGEDGEGEVCPGHSCSDEGECEKDEELDYQCTDVDYSEICDEDCQACTGLKCLWKEQGSKKVHTCDPDPKFGDECDDDNPCTVGDTCGPHPDYDKLSVCAQGEGKTLEECAAELGKDDVLCQFEGIACDPDPEIGCTYDEEKASEWCKPPSTICYNALEVYCTHQDPGTGDWNVETGCNVPETFSCPELPCAENTCFKTTADDGGIKYECQPTAYPDGTACYDGDPCTEGDACAGGQCAPEAGLPQACQGLDIDPTPENPCDGPQCVVTDAEDPGGFECVTNPLDVGTPCEVDDDPCTQGTCQPGGGSLVCQEVLVPTEGLTELCSDNVDNDCDGMVDEFCLLVSALPNWLSGTVKTEDGSLRVWLGRLTITPTGEASTPSGSYTLTITPPTTVD